MTAPAGWTVVVPLKALSQAKSRLRDMPISLRRALVVAMARDVRDAVLACQAVDELVVVTGDPQWHLLLGTPRVLFVPDSPTDSLNPALQRGATGCRSTRAQNGVAALTADLPALRPTELGRALELALGAPTSFVPDALGEGTTMFAARSSEEFRPKFGARSRDRHISAAAREIAWPEMSGIRQDVDTVEDLERAQALGLGRHTSAVAGDVLAADRSGDRRLARPPAVEVR